MPLLPPRFLFRMAHPCAYVRSMPLKAGDDLLDLPEACRINSHAALDGARDFAEVRIGWNEQGLGVRVQVSGKDRPPLGDSSEPGSSDGVTLWLDTRDARGNRRASRYCHQFHLLPSAAGPERDDPWLVQVPIRMAQEPAPLAAPGTVPFRSRRSARGYVVEAFFPTAVLNGYEPEQNPRLGFFYLVRDGELGEQTLSAGPDLPYAEAPNLWQVLELRPKPGRKGGKPGQ